MLELKTCPFCNGEAELVRDSYGRYSIFCTGIDCGASMAGFKVKKQVIDMWNRRNGEAMLIQSKEPSSKELNICAPENLPSAKKHTNICTIHETCERLKEDGYPIAETMLRRMVKIGELPHLQVGKKILLSYTTVYEYVMHGDCNRHVDWIAKKIK